MRHKTIAFLLFFLFVWLPAESLFAQSEPDLVTDRPDQTESASIVPRGRGQIEIGWSFTQDDESGVDVETFEGPGTLLRLGVHDRAEIRIGWDGYVRQDVDFAALGGGSFTVDGLGDMSLGAKFLLVEGSDHRPQVALLVESTVPVGDDEVTSDSYDPSFRFNFAQDLDDRTGYGFNLGVEWQEVAGNSGVEDAASFVYTAVLGRSLTDRWGTFVEIYGSESIDGPDLPSVTALDGGFACLLRPNLQLDFAGGLGLSDSADDWFVGVGLSYRWPS